MSLPPGFRFHPTDEELVAYYLKGKVHGWKIELEIIPKLDIYKCEPWDLPEKSLLPGRDMEWYFFCSRARKYPNGLRTNRATEAGYWKPTGKDRKVSSHMRLIGMKKTLVFYRGRSPDGSRTHWVMHEYCLDKNECEDSASFQEAYALCRVFKKSEPGPRIGEQYGAPVENDFSCGMSNLFNKNSILSVEEQYEENPSVLSDAEDDRPNSKEISSETINDINADDAAMRRLQLLHFDNANCTFRSPNESTNHPKAEHYECSYPPLEVGDFPNIKTCLRFSVSRMPSTYLRGEQIHSPVEETEILEQLYRDAKTSQENKYVSHFIKSNVADIQYNEDYLQPMTSSPGRTQETIKTTLTDMKI